MGSRWGIVVLSSLLCSTLNATFVHASDSSCERALGGAEHEGPESKATKEAKRKAAIAASAKIHAYLVGASQQLLEREYLMDLLELSLLAKEGLLMMGPPGNAKSMIADVVLPNIKEGKTGQSSYYKIQMTPETTLSETHGPLDFKRLMETGEYVRLYKEGMLKSRLIFVDEIFDARFNAMRNTLGVFAERAHSQGPRKEEGLVETFVAATNKYISEVYEKAGDDSPKAAVDRYAFSAFVMGEFEWMDSYINLIRRAKTKAAELPKLTFEDLDAAREIVGEVEIPVHIAKFLAVLSARIKAETDAIEEASLKAYRDKLRNGEDAGVPYRATKYHSPRSIGKAAGILKAMVARDYMRKGGKRELAANLEDVRELEKFFTLNGPSDAFVKEALERSTKQHERAQLMAIQQEREIFRRHYAEILTEINSATVHYGLTELQMKMDEKLSKQEKERLVKDLFNVLFEVQIKSSATREKAAEITGERIGMDMAGHFAYESLKHLLGNQFEPAMEQYRGVFEAAREADRVRREQMAEQQRLAQERQEQEKRRVEDEARQLEAMKKARLEALVKLYKTSEEFEVRRFEVGKSQDQTLDASVTPDSKTVYSFGSLLTALTQHENGAPDASSSRLIKLTETNPRIKSIVGGSKVVKVMGLDSDRVVFVTSDGAWVYNVKSDVMEHDFPLSTPQGSRIQMVNGKIYVLETAIGRVAILDPYTGSRESKLLSSAESLVSSVDGNMTTLLEKASATGYTDIQWVSPDGKRIWFTGAGFKNFFVADLDTGRLTLLSQPHTDFSGYNAVGMSQDKTRIFGWRVLSKKLQILEVSVADPSRVVVHDAGEFDSSNVQNLALLENGTILAVATTNRGLVLVDLANDTYITDRAFGTPNMVKKVVSFGEDGFAWWEWNGNDLVFKHARKRP